LFIVKCWSFWGDEELGRWGEGGQIFIDTRGEKERYDSGKQKKI
jgi:hypothetical protein